MSLKSSSATIDETRPISISLTSSFNNNNNINNNNINNNVSAMNTLNDKFEAIEAGDSISAKKHTGYSQENQKGNYSGTAGGAGALGASAGTGAATGDTESNNDELLFFNYNEYSVYDYFKLDSSKISLRNEQPLVITHFPNPYVEMGQDQFNKTRIVRIPRRYDVIGDAYPKFSNVLPGYEKAALIDPYLASTNNTECLSGKLIVSSDSNEDRKFIIRGKHRDQFFGVSSVSPLSNYLNLKEFQEIINQINAYLKKIYDAQNYSNIFWGILDTLTLSLSSHFFNNVMNDRLQAKELEKYVSELNNNGILKERGIKLISPRRSGYLSLDFQIPRPIL
ncbi:hypothetical protein PACTADRAFT_49575 [Pachysolen tannophilus NRRL Y-2460]|uniref:Ras modification protein ERF4 n=1 Tax=Pachysolen tannophilus NRRL Y-2460 TaxID=669874 RepID=A0A1E4TWR9_PACTA|nr:hypothetical protein PACTADRAFT_49575 [Pachysolen tannophilus NRRL Y-2460]